MSEGWKVSALGEIAEIQIGRTPPRKSPKYWTEDLALPFCSIADMDALQVDPKREGVTQLAVDEGKAKRVPMGSLLMSFKLTIGRVGFAARDLFPNEAIAWVRPRDEEALNLKFLSLVLEATDYQMLTGRAVKGQTLNKDSLARIPVPLPTIDEQRRIADLVESIDQVIVLGGEYANDLRRSVIWSLLSQTHQIPESYDRLIEGDL